MNLVPQITGTGIVKAVACVSHDYATSAVTGAYAGIKNVAKRVGSTSLGCIQQAGSFFTCGKKGAPSQEVRGSEPVKSPSFEVLEDLMTDEELERATSFANVLSPSKKPSLKKRSVSAPLSSPLKALSHSVSAPANLSSTKSTAEHSLDRFLKATGLPENVQNVFKTSLIPPGSIRKCEFGNGKFSMELDKDYQGKVTNVDPKKGMSTLNDVNVFVSQKIEGSYDPTTRTISSLKGISVGFKWASKGLNGFGMKADPTPQSEMNVNAGFVNKDCSNSEFENTLSPEYLKWNQE